MTEPNAKPHDLFDFMEQISREMDAEYERIQKRAAEDPGTAGDQGEENWATLLRGWLPRTYEVVTKGRIISHDGLLSPQIDIVVLSSSYPERLRDKKVFLAGGVVAAFECKNTLKSEHIQKFIDTSKQIKSLCQPRVGSPYSELQASIVYGLLAHSHSWKGQRSTPIENVSNNVFASELTSVEHPRELADLICIADLATWTRSKMINIGTNIWNMKNDQGEPIAKGAVASALVCHSVDKNEADQDKPFTPIGALIAVLFEKIAYEDQQLSSMAHYYSSVGMQGSGSGTMRPWPESVFSDKTKAKILGGGLTFGRPATEWSAHIG